MSCRQSFFSAILVGAVVSWCMPVAVNAQLVADYTYDTGFLTGNPVAQASAEAALADLNAALNQNLGAITTSQQVISGSFNSGPRTATVTLTMSASINDPSNAGGQIDVPVARAGSEVRLYLGARSLGFNGSNRILGVGGPGGSGFAVQAGGNDVDAVVAAAAEAEQIANTVYDRGEGPLVLEIESVLGGTGIPDIPVSVNFGIAQGSIAFSNDDNGDFFHYDHTTEPAAGMIDFYSVALHEAMHAIGLGAAEQWEFSVDGASWSGSEVADYLNSVNSPIGAAGVIVASDGGHIVDGLFSPRITDGVLQQSVLTVATSTGKRSELTLLDLAFLRDMGFANAIGPTGPVSDFNFDGLIGIPDIDFYRDGLADGSVTDFRLDVNGDGVISLADHDFLISNLVQRVDGQAGTLVGDVNLDGNVDVLGDAATLVDSLGSAGVFGYGDGDLNADGTVDVLNDAARLVENLGQSVSARVSVAAVPEPNSAVLIVLMMSAGCLRRRV